VEGFVKRLEHSPGKDAESAKDHSVDGNSLRCILDDADAALSRDGLFHRLLWNMFSAKDQDGMHIKYKNGKASHRFTHSVILMGWALYQVIMAIIMINLLIAIMNNTFSEVWQTADKKWKYSRSYYQAQFLLEKSTFPPPFQWIYYIAKFVHWCKKTSTKDQEKEAEQRKKANETKLEYLRLLKKLITIKQQKELEKTKEDSFVDLREDVKQDMKLEVQDMRLEIQDIKRDIQKILDKFDQLAKQIEK
jgi:hypothetical protein